MLMFERRTQERPHTVVLRSGGIWNPMEWVLRGYATTSFYAATADEGPLMSGGASCWQSSFLLGLGFVGFIFLQISIGARHIRFF
jgi:hypothetical protein